MLGDIAKIGTIGRFRSDLVKNLESNSTELEEISLGFMDRAQRINVASVHEGRAMNAVVGVVCTLLNVLRTADRAILISIRWSEDNLRFVEPPARSFYRSTPIMKSFVGSQTRRTLGINRFLLR